MYCERCGINFASIDEYNRHILQNLCLEDELLDESDNNRMVYTNSGDVIRAEDDISEFLNPDDDDYVP